MNDVQYRETGREMPVPVCQFLLVYLLFFSILLLFVFTMVPQAGALVHGEEKQGRGGEHGSARVRKEGGENGMMFCGIMKRVMKCLYRCVTIFVGFLFFLGLGGGGGGSFLCFCFGFE